MANSETTQPNDTPQLAEQSLDADQQAQVDLIKVLVVTVQHFFGGFERLFRDVRDPRHPAFITYPLWSVLATGVLMFLLHLGARSPVHR